MSAPVAIVMGSQSDWATMRHAAEALDALAKLDEAVQTLPFFGGAKVVWLRGSTSYSSQTTW